LLPKADDLCRRSKPPLFIAPKTSGPRLDLTNATKPRRLVCTAADRHLYGWLVYNDVPDGFTLLGMLVILASGLYVLNEGRKTASRARGNEVAATTE